MLPASLKTNSQAHWIMKWKAMTTVNWQLNCGRVWAKRNSKTLAHASTKIYFILSSRKSNSPLSGQSINCAGGLDSSYLQHEILNMFNAKKSRSMNHMKFTACIWIRFIRSFVELMHAKPHNVNLSTQDKFAAPHKNELNPRKTLKYKSNPMYVRANRRLFRTVSRSNKN